MQIPNYNVRQVAAKAHHSLNPAKPFTGTLTVDHRLMAQTLFSNHVYYPSPIANVQLSNPQLSITAIAAANPSAVSELSL